jgi:hypothetical protein
MAFVTLTVTDIDLAAATYKVDFAASGTEIDDGQATAAYFTGFYLNTIVATQEFADGVVIFGRDLIENMTRENPDMPMTEELATMTISLTDKDITTGRYFTTLENEGGDPTGHSLPTSAQVVGTYMRYLVSDVGFRDAVWAFAEEYVAQNGTAQIANPDVAPSSIAA